MQHEQRMRCVTLSSAACLTLPYFSTCYPNGHDFRKKKPVTEHEICVLILSTTFV